MFGGLAGLGDWVLPSLGVLSAGLAGVLAWWFATTGALSRRGPRRN